MVLLENKNHYLDQNRCELIDKIENVAWVLDKMLEMKIINDEQYDQLRVEPTKQDKMRGILNIVRHFSHSVKDQVLALLKKANPHYPGWRTTPETDAPPDPGSIRASSYHYFPTWIPAEASLFENHEDKPPDYVLSDVTTSNCCLEYQSHGKVHEYYCAECSICICAACYQGEAHQGHQVDTITKVFKQEKENLKNVLNTLKLKKTEIEFKCQDLQKKDTVDKEKSDNIIKRMGTFSKLQQNQWNSIVTDISEQNNQYLLFHDKLSKLRKVSIDRLCRKIELIKELDKQSDPVTFLNMLEYVKEAAMEEGDTQIDASNVARPKFTNVQQSFTVTYTNTEGNEQKHKLNLSFDDSDSNAHIPKSANTNHKASQTEKEEGSSSAPLTGSNAHLPKSANTNHKASQTEKEEGSSSAPLTGSNAHLPKSANTNHKASQTKREQGSFSAPPQMCVSDNMPQGGNEKEPSLFSKIIQALKSALEWFFSLFKCSEKEKCYSKDSSTLL
ncbi:probable serine/threonine-protein kinase DDB_G0283337 [Hyperolius riggenbachi]|uniref:probable serine/threonine-protein kinase DDB_G0283337 n=1 Tax=Hyperolius riggenbachi TaxID=752182 RepID=UPI0035A34371